VVRAVSEGEEPIYTQFRHDAKGAVAHLARERKGIAVAALHHPLIGDIDLVWGQTTDDPQAKGSGLAKIARWHPEVLNDLQGFLLKMDRVQIEKSRKRINLFESSGTARGAIRLEWNGQTRHWLMTAYDKMPAHRKRLQRPSIMFMSRNRSRLFPRAPTP
jgi:hypothetical protein